MPSFLQILVSMVTIWTICYGENTLERDRCFTQPGDILLGMIMGSTQPCTNGGKSVKRDMMENTEAFRHIVDQTNQEETLLPNITLGFVALDMCKDDLSAGKHFIPRYDKVSGWNVPLNCSDGVPYFDVAGVLDTSSGRDSIMLSTMLSVFDIPLFSAFPTSDELSSISNQSEAILEILAHFNWTHFALLYSVDKYGRNGAKYIEQGAHERGFCISVSEIIYEDYGQEDLKGIVDKLDADGKVRAVVIFGHGHILTAVKQSLHGRFVWVGSDGLSCGGYGKVEDEALYISFPDGGDEEFDRYMSTRTAYQTQNIYFKDYIRNEYNCTWDGQTCNDNGCLRSCHEFENDALGDIDPVIYKTLDTTRAMVHGLHNLISTKCPGAFQNVSLLDGCIKGPDYRSAVLDVSFNGTSVFDVGRFDKYTIKQYLADQNRGFQVGTWSLSKQELEINRNVIKWTAFNHQVPESVCSAPTYLLWSHPISIVLVTLTCVSLTLTIAVSAALIHCRDKKLVKASSRELMAIILVGVLLELLTVFPVLARPTPWSCVMVQSGFFISVSVVYAPLLVKTQRVYRIFKAGLQGQTTRLVSTRLMALCAGSLIILQVSGNILSRFEFIIFTMN